MDNKNESIISEERRRILRFLCGIPLIGLANAVSVFADDDLLKGELEQRIIKTQEEMANSVHINKTIFVNEGSGDKPKQEEKSKKLLYLTIDDGPRYNMPKILDQFNDDQHVTFFVIGCQIKYMLKTIYGALERGHLIGNHSYTHPSFSFISLDRAKREIERTHNEIRKVVADVYGQNTADNYPRVFRFPYGDPGFYRKRTEEGSLVCIGNFFKRTRVAKFLNKNDYRTFFWDIDTSDWKYYSSRYHISISTILLKTSRAGDLDNVLMHDNGITSKYIIPFFIKNYSKDFSFRTLA